MLKRILFGYAGFFLARLVSLPIVLVLGPTLLVGLLRTLGLFLGLIVSDWKRQLATKAIVIRTIMAFVALLAWSFVMLPVRDIDISSFVLDHEAAFFGFIAPLVAAVVSEVFSRGSIREQSGERN